MTNFNSQNRMIPVYQITCSLNHWKESFWTSLFILLWYIFFYHWFFFRKKIANLKIANFQYAWILCCDFCFVWLRLESSCAPNVDSFLELSIFDCPFGFSNVYFQSQTCTITCFVVTRILCWFWFPVFQLYRHDKLPYSHIVIKLKKGACIFHHYES